MELLKNKILQDGQVIGGNVLKVDSFLNHQIDVQLFNEIGKEFKERFKHKEVTKILTIEASGIGIACIAAQYFNVPVVFAKKQQGSNMDKDNFQVEVFSFTKNKSYNVSVSKKYISSEDKILIIDDFLANANAASGLIDIVNQGEAEVVGVGIVIEKGFQNGRKFIEEKNVQLESLAIIESMEKNNIIFKN
ncbi:xanthine phosphoribosyltransferase [Clostridium ganghwense]|uniref:Xanthine phosphoribosyltransferase n=1 Tax=Clostridium ganghwense TaxID=312089 RepID=A0ABT4CKX0_9CLOT|nr:xanthine phosphoribosyltransferase [Clostridium ganghwense]MCY6369696.1 xanthine phosphoribosyltransferase [Clostridium ganghwense]